jgi:hypothetical protein
MCAACVFVCAPAAVKVKKANCGTPVAGLGRKMAL